MAGSSREVELEAENVGLRAENRELRERIEELERRLVERATESSGEIGERLRVAHEQLDVAERFDHVVENDDLEHAMSKLSALVRQIAVPAATMPER